MQLTKHFKLEEFKCKDGTPVPKEYIPNVRKLAEELEIIREKLNRPIVIVSGYRTKEHNERVGGAKNSTHLTGKGADIKVIGASNTALGLCIVMLIQAGKIHNGGMKVYDSWCHYDIGKKRRW